MTDDVTNDAVDDATAGVTNKILDVATDLAAGALTDGMQGAVDNATAGVVGMAAGALGAVRKRVLPTADERLAAAEAETIAEYAHRVPELDSRLERVERALTDQYARRTADRRARIDGEIVRLVQRGGFTVEDIESDDVLGEAILRAYRAAFDVVTVDAIPVIARLLARPEGHFFRGACRVLVELDRIELSLLQQLVGAGVRAIAIGGYNFPVLRADPTEPVLITDDWGEASRRNELTLFEVEDGQMAWHTTDGERVVLERHDHLVRLLLTHRLADPPKRGRRLEIEGYEVPGRDDTVLQMWVTTLLDLHFALSDERVPDPRQLPTPGTSE